VFISANAALVVIKRREGAAGPGFRVPLAVPAGGAIVSLALIVAEIAR
jgi:hypothetical protein